MEEIKEAGYTYHADISHAGRLSCDKAILDAHGVTHLWDAPSQDEWEVEVECNTYTHYIAHCFDVTAPDGTVLKYGVETPHGKIGSQEFTLWWNELPLDTLEYADCDSWCDG